MPETLEQLEADLGPDLRALAPEPRPGFALDVTVRAARPRPRAAAPWWRRVPVLLPVAGALAAALVALVVAAGVLRPAGDDVGARGGSVAGEAAGGGAEPATGPAAAGDASGGDTSASGSVAPADAAGRAAPSPVPSPGPGLGPESLRPERAVERSAELALAAPGDEVPEVARGVARATRAAGGYVATSQVGADEEEASASFTLRVPSARLDALLARLSDLADVRSLRRAEIDVTGPLGVAERRLSDARDERRALVRALATATDPARVRALRIRLADARRLEGFREAQLRRVRRRADLATVELTVASRADGAGTWSPGDAPGTALRVLAAVGGALLVAAAAALPVVLLLGLALAVRAALRRRARDRVLRAAG